MVATLVIVLGESVTGVVAGLSSNPTDLTFLIVAVAAVLIGFGAWWTYFDFVGYRVPLDRRPMFVVWLLSHLPLAGAIASLGATTAWLVEHSAASRTPASVAWLACGSEATVLAFTAVLMTTLRDRGAGTHHFRLIVWAYLLAGVLLVGIAVLRPVPVILAVMVIIAFGLPWSVAVLRSSLPGLDTGARRVSEP